MRPNKPELYNSKKRNEKPIPHCDFTDVALQPEAHTSRNAPSSRNVPSSRSNNIPVQAKTSTNQSSKPKSKVQIMKSKFSKAFGIMNRRPSLLSKKLKKTNRRFDAFPKQKCRTQSKIMKKHKIDFIETKNEFNGTALSLSPSPENHTSSLSLHDNISENEESICQLDRTESIQDPNDIKEEPVFDELLKEDENVVDFIFSEWETGDDDDVSWRGSMPIPIKSSCENPYQIKAKDKLSGNMPFAVNVNTYNKITKKMD